MAEAERAMNAREEAGAVADPVGVPHTGTASQA
jgi:hypothetical protein